MVTQITLGTFGTQNGKNVLTGGASQIDTKTLVEALVAARRQPAVRLETVDKALDKQTEALNQLKTLFTKLQTAADTLRNPPGVGVDAKNIFQYRTVSLSSATGASASNYVDVTVTPGAAAQSYTIDSITTIAKQTKQQSGDILIADATTASAVTAATPGLFQPGTVNIRAVDGTVGGIPITLNAGDSLSAVASKFNEVSSRTGIQATVLTVAPGTYKLLFSATKTGTTYGFDLNATAPAPGAGIESDPSGVFAQFGAISTPQSAANASFSINGVPLTRESNSISDVIDKVTFTLKQPSAAAGIITADVIPDTTLASNAVTAFADAYNDFRLFASNQSQMGDDGKPKETSVLYNDPIFRNMIDGVSTEITRVVAGITGSNPSILADIGVTIDNFAGDDENPATKNILTVDPDALKSALLSNFDGVRKVFEYTQTSSDVNFATFKRSNNLNNITGFQLVIDRTAGTYKATYTDPVAGLTTVDLTGNAISGGGVGLKGQSGTIFEGSEFVYAGTGDATIDVTITQGFGDRFYNLMDTYLDSSTGVLTQEITGIADSKKRNTDEIKSIDEKLTSYREQLIAQYAKLESAISSANQILQLLDAQANARNNG